MRVFVYCTLICDFEIELINRESQLSPSLKREFLTWNLRIESQ